MTASSHNPPDNRTVRWHATTLGDSGEAELSDRAKGAEEWRSYLSGQYVCLRSVRPDTIVRKDSLTSAIGETLADPKPESMLWRARLHILVDELESVELPFTGCDRLRFCGPTSRDTLIDSVRTRFPLDNRRVVRADSDQPAASIC